MRFQLVDRIIELVPGKRIVAVKNLTSAEEYLADHFPGFPVMPGVLMLEALVQSAAWLQRITENFGTSLFVLRELKSIKYANFVEPGRQLLMTVEIDKNTQDNRLSGFRGNGEIEGVTAVTSRFLLERCSLAEKGEDLALVDDQLRSYYRQQYALLKQQPKEPAQTPG